jgi:hypothetical protein
MSSALAKASSLKADIRLAKAVSEFEADLTNEQKFTLRTLRTQSLSATPSPSVSGLASPISFRETSSLLRLEMSWSEVHRTW